MSFKNAIQSIEQISQCYRTGLQALGSSSSKVKPTVPRSCKGSVDMDACLVATDPNASRWDYIVGYNSKVFYIEIHPASSSEVDAVINKLNWLKTWIEQAGTPIREISNQSGSYHWIASGKVTILKNSVYARRLAQVGLDIPKTYLTLQ